MLCNKALIAAFALSAQPPPLPGDIIFIGGTGGWADIGARFSQTDKRYGHVGVVISARNGPAVVHASGAPASGGTVTITPLSDFTALATNVAVYRPARETMVKLIRYTLTARNKTIAFDGNFSLESEDAVYCTELVWRGLSAALGKDAVPQKTSLYGKLVITLEDLQNSPHLTPISHFDTRETPAP